MRSDSAQSFFAIAARLRHVAMFADVAERESASA
jgi:hypothetical protein